MKSATRGAGISRAEVTNVSRQGLWLLLDCEELFVPFEQFPWFRDASVAAVTNVERTSADHLHWPDLDIDLTVELIRHPENFPLVYRARG